MGARLAMAIGGGERRPLRASTDHSEAGNCSGRTGLFVGVTIPAHNPAKLRRCVESPDERREDLRGLRDEDREAAVFVQESDDRGVEGDLLARPAAWRAKGGKMCRVSPKQIFPDVARPSP
jgi:hypothetical protein